MFVIPKSVINKMPYVGPALSAVGLTLDVKKIVETATPVGAAKIIARRLVTECTPPELLIAGKCVMLVGGIIATVTTGGNPLVVGSTISVARSIVRD